MSLKNWLPPYSFTSLRIAAAAICGPLLLAFSSLALANEPAAHQVSVEQETGKVVVKVDGELFTEYLERAGAKPVLWPVLGPSGQELTRGYPQRDKTERERDDHIHQRSFWFTHGDVNGTSFWHEQDRHGTIVHREFTELSSGEVGVIETVNDWLDADGMKVCEDKRRFVFGANDLGRWIDVSITVTASEGVLRFGDTKEGSFGVRVAGTIKVEEGLGGRILNSDGLIDGEAWGKPARWVDYSGPVGDARGGIAILNHPSSYGYPTHWHVRTYGLFAANPFGLHDFYSADSGRDGTLELQQGETLQLGYRVLLHDGNVSAEQIDGLFEEYVK